MSRSLFRVARLNVILSLLIASNALSTLIAVAIEQPLSDWQVHQQMATKLDAEDKFLDALVEYEIAYQALKNDDAASPDLVILCRHYGKALDRAGLKDESKRVLKAVNSLSRPLAVGINNLGVRSLNESKYEQAISQLELAVKLGPDYQLAADNLSIAYNNHGLKVARDNPSHAAWQFRRALLVNPGSEVASKNLHGALKLMNKDGSDFNTRVSIGDDLLKRGDNPGAYVEYREALKLKEDADTRKKLQSIPITDEPIFVTVRKEKEGPKPEDASIGKPSVTGSGMPEPALVQYITDIQKLIKKSWRPPIEQTTRQCKVVFHVSTNGTVTDVKISKSSGVPTVDGAGLAAIYATKLPPLPKGSPDSVAVEFTFAYNVYMGDKKVGSEGDGEDSVPTQQLLAESRRVREAVLDAITLLRSVVEKEENQKIAGNIAEELKRRSDAPFSLLVRVESLAAPDTITETFNSTMKTLGKDASLDDDVIAVAEKQRSAKNFDEANLILRQGLKRSPSSEKLLRAQRALNAYVIAFEIGGYHEVLEAGTKYHLYQLTRNLRDVASQAVTMADPDIPSSFPLLPSALEMTPSAAATSTKTSPSALPVLTTLVGLDDVPPAELDIEAELKKLGKEIDKDRSNATARGSQYTLLVQYGNKLKADPAKAALKYREAVYVNPAGDAAREKLNQCLKQMGLDPSSPATRLSLFADLEDNTYKKASIAELWAYNRLVDDGPSNALLGLHLLRDSVGSGEGLQALTASLGKTWPPDSKKMKEQVHFVLARVMQGQASASKDPAEKDKLISNASAQLRQILLMNPRNELAANMLLDLSQEAVHSRNNSTNNLMIGGVLILKGDINKAGPFYTAALERKPGDKFVIQCWERYKAISNNR